jgi:hypothetical protein
MLNKIVTLAIVVVLATLLMPSQVNAWGAARVSAVRVGPYGGVYGGSRTVVGGPGGVYAGGRAYGVGGATAGSTVLGTVAQCDTGAITAAPAATAPAATATAPTASDTSASHSGRSGRGGLWPGHTQQEVHRQR